MSNDCDLSCTCHTNNAPCSHCTDCIVCNSCYTCERYHGEPKNKDCPSLIEVGATVTVQTMQDVFDSVLASGATGDEAWAAVGRHVASAAADHLRAKGFETSANSLRDEFETTSVESPSLRTSHDGGYVINIDPGVINATSIKAGAIYGGKIVMGGKNIFTSGSGV